MVYIDDYQVEAPSAASIVANGISGKMIVSDPKIEPKSVAEEVDAGGNTAVGGEAGDAEVEKPLRDRGGEEKVTILLISHTGRLWD